MHGNMNVKSSSMPNRQRKCINIETPERNCKKQTRQYGTTKWLCLEAVIKNLHETYHCRMYSRKLLMMVTEDARNM